MNIYQSDHRQTPEIFNLIREFKNEEAKMYLKSNPAEIKLKGWLDHSTLHVAAEAGNFDMVKYLIDNGAETNARRSGVYATPLCWATTLEIAKHLLDKGATMNDLELYSATRQNRVEIVNLLLTKGAKINFLNPEYLACCSIECIKVYLERGVDIRGSDQQRSNLLHKLVWLDAPDVFDFAYNNGCDWEKDSSQRTPYYLAKEGNREKTLRHLKEYYPSLVSRSIENTSLTDFNYDRIFFIKQSNIDDAWFICLTKNGNLVKYLLKDGELIASKVGKLNMSTIRNFTFDESGDIILPTGDNELLVIDQVTFEIKHTIDLSLDLNFDQIQFLPMKNIYIASSSKWEIVVLDKNFNVLKKIGAEDGTIYPKVNYNESLISFLSYDQTTYFDLYELNEDFEVKFIHTFFEDWDNTSTGFDFNEDNFAVTFPQSLEYYNYVFGEMTKIWELDISKYKSEGFSCIVFVGENEIAVGKGKSIIFVNTENQEIFKVQKLDIQAEIRVLVTDKMKMVLIIITDQEIKSINLKHKQ